jgi:hypothetical protein
MRSTLKPPVVGIQAAGQKADKQGPDKAKLPALYKVANRMIISTAAQA